MVLSPSITQQEISQNLYDMVKPKIRGGKILYAPVDVILSEENTVIPDLLFIRKDNLKIIKEKYIKGIPDLIIEITSSNRTTDLDKKYHLYPKFQVKEYLIIDTKKKQIRQCILNQNSYDTTVFDPGDSFESSIIEDCTIEVSNVFSTID